jgi:two-component system response regulator AtoC
MARDAAELENRIQNLTEKLLSTFEELDFVHSLAQVLARPEGVLDLDAYLLRETQVIFHADGGWVARWDASGRVRTTAALAVSPATTDFLNERLLQPLGERRALPYLVDDLPAGMARVLGNGGREVQARSAAVDFPRAFLAVPLEVHGEVLGVISLAKQKPGEFFTSGDQKLLSTLALQAALFIKNADLVQRLRAEAQRLGRRVEQLETDARSRPDISWIRGPSPAMRRLAQQVEVAAATEATVLLLGESGTGKSLIARILHRLSARRNGPFVEVNCGAVAPGLIESELFGHARGAFTGADRARAGLFEEANKGIIFLDEVAELPPESQVKLLTVLEAHRIRRVGENQDRPVDVRVVAATNADLGAKVRAGTFREDVFYRLNVLSLTVPPLRQRPDDILPLAGRFLMDLARETNRRIRGFSPEAERALLAYSWPGNVRELRNVVERSLLLKTGGEHVLVDDLPFTLPLAGPARTGTNADAGSPGLPLSQAVDAYEKRRILEALRETNGIVAEAAASLGISRTNLHNKLRKHGLARSQNWK